MKAASWLPLLQGIADQAERIALRLFRKADLRVEQKQDSSPVTEADWAIEEMARQLARIQISASCVRNTANVRDRERFV